MAARVVLHVQIITSIFACKSTCGGKSTLSTCVRGFTLSCIRDPTSFARSTRNICLHTPIRLREPVESAFASKTFVSSRIPWATCAFLSQAVVDVVKLRQGV